jgi:hypothetical protein
MRLDERLAGDHLIRPCRVHPAAAAQEDVVHLRAAFGIDGDEAPAGRLVQPGTSSVTVGDHAGVDGGHAGDGGDVLQPQRRALERGEHVGESLSLVIGALGPTERLEVREVHDVHRHAATHHQRDRERLPLHAQQIAH